MVMLEVYRSMALVERKRLDGPPRGGAVAPRSIRDDDEFVTRADIEAIVGISFQSAVGYRP